MIYHVGKILDAAAARLVDEHTFPTQRFEGPDLRTRAGVNEVMAVHAPVAGAVFVPPGAHISGKDMVLAHSSVPASLFAFDRPFFDRMSFARRTRAIFAHREPPTTPRLNLKTARVSYKRFMSCCARLGLVDSTVLPKFSQLMMAGILNLALDQGPEQFRLYEQHGLSQGAFDAWLNFTLKLMVNPAIGEPVGFLCVPQTTIDHLLIGEHEFFNDGIAYDIMVLVILALMEGKDPTFYIREFITQCEAVIAGDLRQAHVLYSADRPGLIHLSMIAQAKYFQTIINRCYHDGHFIPTCAEDTEFLDTAYGISQVFKRSLELPARKRHLMSCALGLLLQHRRNLQPLYR